MRLSTILKFSHLLIPGIKKNITSSPSLSARRSQALDLPTSEFICEYFSTALITWIWIRIINIKIIVKLLTGWRKTLVIFSSIFCPHYFYLLILSELKKINDFYRKLIFFKRMKKFDFWCQIFIYTILSEVWGEGF